MSKIDEKLGEVIDKLTKLAETHAGAAIDVAASVVQMNGAASIFQAGATLAIAMIVARWAYRIGKRVDWSEGPDAPTLGCIGLGVSSGFGVIIAAVELLTFWYWVALFNPKLALAKQIMRAAGL